MTAKTVPAWIHLQLPSGTTSDTQATVSNVTEALTVTDQRALFAFNKARKNKYLQRKNPAAYRANLKTLEAAVKRCLLYPCPRLGPDVYRTYAGLAPEIEDLLGQKLDNRVDYPEPNSLPWASKPFPLRPYQAEIVDAMLAERHAAVEVATALGKSRCILELCRRLGLQAVVMAPSKSIAHQLLDDLQKYLGKKHVGLFGDGRKDLKLVTVGIAASLSQVEAGSPAWSHLSQAKVLIVDESHLVAAKTLESVACSLLEDAPYRFFFSGTQMRSDGLTMLLQGIIGPVVYRMTVRDGVDQGWLARPVFHMLEVDAQDNFQDRDVNEMTRHHCYYNPAVAAKACEIVAAGLELGRPVLVLIEEIEQYGFLRAQGLDALGIDWAFAHGPLTPENRAGVEEEHQSDDSAEAVRKFNDGEVQLLIGTSSVSIGTDVRPCQILVRLKFGRSEVDVRQDVGRGLRKPEGKVDCWVFDFLVRQDDMERHARIRADLYTEIYGPVVWAQ